MPQQKLDDDLVHRLAKIAARLDGGNEEANAPLVDEFNQLAGTDIPFSEFQGIYGAGEHVDSVRRVLTDEATEMSRGLDRQGLTAMFAKAFAETCDGAYLQYVFTTIKKTLGDSRVADLAFWPGEYFGDGDKSART